jgi:hypothetical protein
MYLAVIPGKTFKHTLYFKISVATFFLDMKVSTLRIGLDVYHILKPRYYSTGEG